MLKARAKESLYERARILAERKTVLAVRHCQNLIESEFENRFRIGQSADIQEYFQSLDGALRDFHPYSIVEEIYVKRFGIRLDAPCLNVEMPAIDEMEALIQEWSRTKGATVNLTKLIEMIGSEVCQQAVDKAFASLAFTAAFDASGITQAILAGLGISSEAEAEEMRYGVNQRLNGVLTAIKTGLLQQINLEVAKLFYRTHDALIEQRIAEKIRRLQARETKTMKCNICYVV